MFLFFFFKQKTAYEMRISDWSSDVCSSDLPRRRPRPAVDVRARPRRRTARPALRDHDRRRPLLAHPPAVPPRKRSDAAVSGLVDGRDRKRRAVRLTRLARATVNDAKITRVSRQPNVPTVNNHDGVKVSLEG